MAKITGAIGVWLSPYSILGPSDIKPGCDLTNLTFADRDSAYWPESGYTLVGEASVTIKTMEERDIIANKVNALKAEKKRVIADAQAKATELEKKIQTLLAITYEA